MTPPSAYRPGREIARGGMGAVLDARDQKLGRSVAMKVMLRRNASEEEQQRFLQEARVLGQLAHPNIVPVHDLGTDEQGRLFYIMKLVQGVTLHDVIGKLKAGDKDTLAKYPLNALLTIFQKVCDAVAFAHSRGIIHRDLKPQNVMVGEFGEVLVMDWGLAKLLPGSPAAEEAAKTLPLRGQLGQTGPTGTLPLNPPLAEEQATLVAGSAAMDQATVAAGTGSASAPKLAFGSQQPEPAAPSGTYATLEGAVMGTPHFMSPEQAEGKIAELDARSDIFSLGGILYALLTLRPPVEGDSLEEILSKVRSGTIAPPTHFNAPSTSATAKPPAATGTVIEPKKIYPLAHCPGGKVPSALSAVTMKALTRDKAQRYQSVAEFTRDIEAYQGGFATSAENADALTLALLFFRRNKVLASAAGLVLLVILIALPLVIASERKAKANAQTAREHEAQARTNAKAAEENAAQARATLADLRRTAPVFAAQAKVDFENGQRETAIEKLGYAIQLDESNADYHLARANLRQSVQEFSAAAEGYRRVLALRPADAVAKLNLALCEKLLQESGGGALARPQQLQLLAALRQQKRLVESAPLAALIDPDIASAKAALEARLREFTKQPGWKGKNRIEALPDGTFKVDLHSLAPGDLSVLKGQPVSILILREMAITDIGVLAGLPLKELELMRTKVADLSPLRGMPLETLNLQNTAVTDLTPLRGMKLRSLSLNDTRVSDLGPLAGMPLEILDCTDCRQVRDLSPLRGAPLQSLTFRFSPITSLTSLAGMPLRRLTLISVLVKDLAPLAQCPTLEALHVSRSLIADLAPLRELRLTEFGCAATLVSELTPLRGHPLRTLDIRTPDLKDLGLLAEMPTLEEVAINEVYPDLSPLRQLPKLRLLSTRIVGSGADVHPAQTAAEFWQEYDAKETAAKQARTKNEAEWQERAKRWGAGSWVDILSPLTPEIVATAKRGWRMEKGVLLSPDQAFAILPLPGDLRGTSYSVRLKLRQHTAKEVFHLCLPAGDRMIGFELDGWPTVGFYTSLVGADVPKSKDLPGALHGQQVKDDKPHELEVAVLLEGPNVAIDTKLDGQPFYRWTGPLAKLGDSKNWESPQPGTLGLGAHRANWEVHGVMVKRVAAGKQ